MHPRGGSRGGAIPFLLSGFTARRNGKTARLPAGRALDLLNHWRRPFSGALQPWAPLDAGPEQKGSGLICAKHPAGRPGK